MKRIIYVATDIRHGIVGVWWSGCVQRYGVWKKACINLGAKYFNKIEFDV